MTIVRTLWLGSLSLAPPVIGGCVSYFIAARFGARFLGFTNNADSLAIGFLFASVCSAAYALVQFVKLRRESVSAKSAWISGLEFIALPLAVLLFLLWLTTIGWAMAACITHLHRAIAGTSTFTSSITQSALSACAAGAALYAGIAWTRMSTVQRIWHLADKPRGERKLLAIHAQAVRQRDQLTLTALAKMPRMQPAILRQLAADPDLEVRVCVANNPNTPVDVLREMAATGSAEIQRAIAHNDAAPIEVLSELARSPHAEVRQRSRQRLFEQGADAPTTEA